jgi:hypothetical protein
VIVVLQVSSRLRLQAQFNEDHHIILRLAAELVDNFLAEPEIQAVERSEVVKD